MRTACSLRLLASLWWVAALAGAGLAAKEGNAEPKRAAPAETGHWSFQPIRSPALPAVEHRDRLRNEIDAFVLARLEREGIEPSPEADRYTLIRRLSLDLLGLPPTPAQVEAFLQDDGPDAYDRLVGRLLASPHFGERWGRHWLDLARYADSDGYEKDLYRPHAWRWRDWVIRAINDDMPVDQFTVEQIAGDLLPGATIEQRIATGFHRNTLLNREGGVDLEEDRVKIVVDRVNTLGTTWLGLTVGCAECHDHKYDPISQREFYRLYAFFNSTDDRDIRAPLPDQTQALEQKRTEYVEAQRRYVDPARVAQADPEFESWSSEVSRLPDIWTLPESYELPTLNATMGSNLYLQEDGSFLITGTVIDGEDSYVAMFNTPMEKITAIRLELLTDKMLPNHGPGWGPNGNCVLSEVTIETSPLSNVTDLRTFEPAKVVADYSQPGFEVEKSVDGDKQTGWAVDLPHLPMAAVDRCAVFLFGENAGHPGGTRVKFFTTQAHGEKHKIGRFRVSITSEDPDLVVQEAVPQRIRDLARVPAGERSLGEQTTLLRYYHSTYKQQDTRLAAITDSMYAVHRARGDVWGQTLAERTTPRPTNVHIRGVFLNKGEAVSRGTPAVLHRLDPRGSRPDRRDLARWLVDPANPLTPRVTVNRIWQHLFGAGVVTTVADFGTQGEPPSHPELLDWLASELIRRGWSRKALIKLIVTSATYRQSSAHRPELLDRDPDNRLLARQNRYRLEAEVVRDQFLATSGLLERRLGGPSVSSDEPRRGLYVELRRKGLDPMLVTFDAPKTMVTCPRRERSNTPLQGLTLMNEPLFFRCAQTLSRRVLAEKPDAGAQERIGYLFQLCVTRPPTDQDVADLTELLDSVRAFYESNPEEAAKVVGDSPPQDVPLAEAAAWTIVARVVLNLDELIMRE